MKEKVDDMSKKMEEIAVEIASCSYIQRFHDQAKKCSTFFNKESLA